MTYREYINIGSLIDCIEFNWWNETEHSI